jgi:putative DNA primase/helicase
MTDKQMTRAELEKQLEQLRNQHNVVFPDVNDKNVILKTADNFKQLCRHYGIVIRYNEMSKEEEVTIPNTVFHADTANNARISKVRDLCARSGMPEAVIQDYITLVASENPYHPVREWIDQQPAWDGVDRVQIIADSVILRYDNPLKDTIIRKWLLSAVAALYHPNFSCEGVLTWHGSQAAGKTSKWIERILPRHAVNVWNKDAVVINMDNKDTQLKALGYWISELGELDATFRKSDLEALKGFITEKFDVIRPPYARMPNKYSRRTVFYGSVNEQGFLVDTQNRRFWVLSVLKFMQLKDFDIGQLWSQLKQHYQRIAPLVGSLTDAEANNEFGWFMSPDERDILHDAQERFRTIDPIVEKMVVRCLDPDDVGANPEWLTVTQILTRCGQTHIGRKETNPAAGWLRSRGYRENSQGKFYVEVQITDIVARDEAESLIIKEKLKKFWKDKR